MAGLKNSTDNNELPDLADFSVSAIRQAIQQESLLHPLTLYPSALGLLSGLAALLYQMPLLFAGMGGLLAVGAASSVVNYFFRKDAISQKYLGLLSKRFAKQRQHLLKTLERDLHTCSEMKGLKRYAQQGHKQFSKIEHKYKKLHSLLNQKFKTTELTHGSYLGAAEQVYLSVLDNLVSIVSLMQGIGSIDPEYIKQRHRQLEKLEHIDEADEREFKTLKKREKLRTKQMLQVNKLLTDNEESMTVLDETIAAIAALETGNGLASVDLETAMEHLQELAGRTSMYNKKTN